MAANGSPTTFACDSPPTSRATDGFGAFEFHRVERQYAVGEMSIFRELTEGLPRQAPGSASATLRALGLVRGLPTRPRILDVGCGPGAQTVELARATGGWIVAVDIRQRFLDELTERAAAAGILPQVTTVNTSMFDMDFADASFDLIWSEGAIYIQDSPPGSPQ